MIKISCAKAVFSKQNLKLNNHFLCTESGQNFIKKNSNAAPKHSFSGFTSTIMKWNESNSEWRLSVYGNSLTYAICNETGLDYPFGDHKWYIFNDECQYFGSEQKISKNAYKLTLNFNGCNTKDEFNCKDGTW